jgi:hypothetical protein
MNIPIPKYSEGTQVWQATTTSCGHDVLCPDCVGKGVWYCTLPNGEQQNIPCPSCGEGKGKISMWEYKPVVRMLTIGSVRLDTSAEKPITYMCEETGIGSGTVYYEDSLWLTDGAAQLVANRLADEANARAQQRFIDDLTYNRKIKQPGSLTGYLRRKATDLRKQVAQIEAHIASLAKENA